MGGKVPPDSIETQILYRPYPMDSGATYRMPHLVYDLSGKRFAITDTILITCADTDAPFKTSLGTFSCIVYSRLEKFGDDVLLQNIHYEFYAIDLGLVGRLTYSYNPISGARRPSSKMVLSSTNVPIPLKSLVPPR
jgi:hypothetical protein